MPLSIHIFLTMKKDLPVQLNLNFQRRFMLQVAKRTTGSLPQDCRRQERRM
jgi:hypothetical protein